MSDKAQHVFIIGAKNIGAYGGFETFVDKLTEYHQNNHNIKYHIACKANGYGCMDETKLEGIKRISDSEFIYHNAHCFKLHVPQIGNAQAIYYDIAALDYCCKYIQRHKIPHPIVYILACRIGPVMHHYYAKIHKLGGRIYLNPDGHEWARSKWNRFIKLYWKLSERLMVKYSDFVICDSVAIEKYIHSHYDKKGIRGSDPRTIYIAYGADTRKSKVADDDPQLLNWYHDKCLTPKNYYLVVGRFVPENNYEIMIREFMKSTSKRNLALITNRNDKFWDELEQKLHFRNDKRIKFVGTVYDHELLMKIRENAYGYIHGHEVGGTNPSLLEALGSTDVNLLLDVEFNREVAQDAAVYWNKQKGSLSRLINKTEKLDINDRDALGKKAKNRIQDAYSWPYIADQYTVAFTELK